MTDPAALHAQALGAFRSGRIAEAERLAARLLDESPDHPGALYIVGMARMTAGDAAGALQWLSRAADADPSIAAIRLAHGMALWNAGRTEEGLAAAEQAAALAPRDASILAHLASLYFEAGRNEDACEACRRCVEIAPEWPAGQRSLGAAARAVGRMDEAIDAFRRAAELDPGDAEALVCLADTLQQAGRPEEAAIEWERAARARPDDADIWTHLGTALRESGNGERSGRAYERALELNPGSPAAHGGMGVLLYETCRFAEARRHFEASAAAQPDSAVAIRHLWNVQLLLGDCAPGWRNFDRWMDMRVYNVRDFEQPRWSGGPIGNRTLLVYSDHGFGDAIHMARFMPEVRARANGRVAIECQPELVRLFEASDLADQVVARRSDNGPPDIRFDVQIGMMRLPGLFGTTLETIPAAVPYLSVPDPAAQAWRDRIPGEGTLRVGIRWQGNPGHPNNRLRSCLLADLLPLARIGGVRLYSLQTDRLPDAEDPCPEGLEIVDPAPDLSDFLETAAAISSLDLVITADTAVAHVAGALAKPVWVLLPRVPDWRWLIGRDDSPWYPTMRLFRQTEAGRWDDVIRSVAESLRTRAAQPPPA